MKGNHRQYSKSSIHVNCVLFKNYVLQFRIVIFNHVEGNIMAFLYLMLF